jgi:hypothetical protein
MVTRRRERRAAAVWKNEGIEGEERLEGKEGVK